MNPVPLKTKSTESSILSSQWLKFSCQSKILYLVSVTVCNVYTVHCTRYKIVLCILSLHTISTGLNDLFVAFLFNQMKRGPLIHKQYTIKQTINFTKSESVIMMNMNMFSIFSGQRVACPINDCLDRWKTGVFVGLNNGWYIYKR